MTSLWLLSDNRGIDRRAEGFFLNLSLSREGFCDHKCCSLPMSCFMLAQLRILTPVGAKKQSRNLPPGFLFSLYPKGFKRATFWTQAHLSNTPTLQMTKYIKDGSCLNMHFCSKCKEWKKKRITRANGIMNIV